MIRSIPILAKISVCLSGFFVQFGWFFGGFGTLVFWLFVLNNPQTTDLLITGIFPLVGFSLVLSQMPRALKIIRLLERGVVTFGEYSRAEKTAVSVNDEPLYKVYFTFKTNDGSQGEAFTRSTDPEQLASASQLQLVYDPMKISNAVLLQELPKELRLNSFGEFEMSKIPIRLFIIPLPTVCWNVWALLQLVG